MLRICSRYLGAYPSPSPHRSFFKVRALFHVLPVNHSILLMLKNRNKYSGHLGNQDKILFLNILDVQKISYPLKNEEQFLLTNVLLSRYRRWHCRINMPGKKHRYTTWKRFEVWVFWNSDCRCHRGSLCVVSRGKVPLRISLPVTHKLQRPPGVAMPALESESRRILDSLASNRRFLFYLLR